jgi:NTE family protein
MARKPRSTSPKPISLALQGGGAHGALSWGVLETLARSKKIDVKAITATSAGAMNAVAFAAGMAKGGPEGAVEGLETFWSEVSKRSAPYSKLRTPPAIKALLPRSPFNLMSVMTALASPYDLNPFDLNPLRDAVEASIDFDAARNSGIALHLAATNVETGRARVFTGDEINTDAVLASACLPQTFKAVEIDGAPYWDGGYMGNPSLFPLIYSDAPKDILLVMLNPLSRAGVPKTASAIQDRLNEINFNSSLIGELRAISFVQKLLDDDLLANDAQGNYRRLFLHIIRGGAAMCDLALETKYDTDIRFLTELRSRGVSLAEDWLADCVKHVGKQSGFNVRSEFLEPNEPETA